MKRALPLMGAVPAGYQCSYDTSVTDSLKLVAVSTNSSSSSPVSLTARFTGNQLQLSWPSDHVGWTLQIQTNKSDAGLGTNWVNVPGSNATNSMVIPISTTNGSVFLRLSYR